MRKQPKVDVLPSGLAVIDGKPYPIVYKVVTKEMQSLGLRGNTNILTYPVLNWLTLPPKEIVHGDGGWRGVGGIWAARTKSKAYGLEDHMIKTHGIPVSIYLAAARNILYTNSYRVKMGAIFLIQQLESRLESKI